MLKRLDKLTREKVRTILAEFPRTVANGVSCTLEGLGGEPIEVSINVSNVQLVTDIDTLRRQGGKSDSDESKLIIKSIA